VILAIGFCVQGLKRGDKGLCLIAGDIYPIDVISHLPILCEEKETPYIYVPSKHDLGECSGVVHSFTLWPGHYVVAAWTGSHQKC
jgi:ribosomal protein L7Ae-like RNA K-turn-binding protein